VADANYLVYGLHAVESVVDRRPGDIRRAWCLARADSESLIAIRQRLEMSGIEVAAADRPSLDRLCDGGRHQGIVLDVRPPSALDVVGLETLVTGLGRRARLLVLDQVEDPRNLGACLRSADAAGADCIIVPKAHSARLTAAALKAATGAADTVPVAIVPNLARTLAWLKAAGVWIVGADGQATRTVYEARLEPPVALVLGAEGRGLRRLTREACDELLRIPLFGTVESLNVSVAAGILLFELARQSPPQ
jgi:23S rRNA (guanosine2251-2'-O)-methyltransferase